MLTKEYLEELVVSQVFLEQNIAPELKNLVQQTLANIQEYFKDSTQTKDIKNAISGILQDVSRHRATFIDAENKQMIRLYTRELGILAVLIDIFSKKTVGISDIKELADQYKALISIVRAIQANIQTFHPRF